MPSVKHRRVVTAGKPSVAAYLHGQGKLRNSPSKSEPASVRSETPIRPNSSVVNEAIRVFAIGRNQAGFWIARDCDGSACGLFLSKAGAVRFAKRTSGADGCTLKFVSDGLELKTHSSAARAWHNVLPMGIANLIARFKLDIEELFIRPRRKPPEREEVVEQDLYRNRYRHRSKSDDDLPIERADRRHTLVRGE
jgi:hypothetical protein